MFDKNKVKIGIAPIAWTEDDAGNGSRKQFFTDDQ